MKKLLIILFSVLFFLPVVKGQRINSVSKLPSGINYINFQNWLQRKQTGILLFGGCRKVVYVIDGKLIDSNLLTVKPKYFYGFQNARSNKSYTEQDFQYIPFEHFLKTLPGLQQ